MRRTRSMRTRFLKVEQTSSFWARFPCSMQQDTLFVFQKDCQHAYLSSSLPGHTLDRQACPEHSVPVCVCLQVSIPETGGSVLCTQLPVRMLPPPGVAVRVVYPAGGRSLPTGNGPTEGARGQGGGGC